MTASSPPSSVQPTTPPGSSFAKRRELPALSLPHGREDRRGSAVLSIALHVFIIMLLVTPFALHHAIFEEPQGAGGPGAAGGGGGGHAGTGGVMDHSERLQFIQVAPPKAAPTQAAVQPVVPPPQTPIPRPEPVKVEPVPKPAVETKMEVAAPAKLPDIAATPGAGGGTGHDGTSGSGPGTGGGVGTGIGTGRGAGVGPGTGGGDQVNFPPQPIEFFLPPLPAPAKVRGFHLVAEFDVDSLGRVRGFDFTPTKDGDYNKRLAEVLRGMRFRAGARPDGTPIRMKAQISYEF